MFFFSMGSAGLFLVFLRLLFGFLHRIRFLFVCLSVCSQRSFFVNFLSQVGFCPEIFITFTSQRVFFSLFLVWDEGLSGFGWWLVSLRLLYFAGSLWRLEVIIFCWNTNQHRGAVFIPTFIILCILVIIFFCSAFFPVPC